jgi:probable addiction module antidote protein
MKATRRKRTPTLETLPYDVAEQLRTPEEMAAYLEAWLEEAPEDVSGIARALGDIARAKGMSAVARDTGLSRESLYKSLSENGNPSLATVLKVAKALGLRFRVGDGLRTGRRDQHGKSARSPNRPWQTGISLTIFQASPAIAPGPASPGPEPCRDSGHTREEGASAMVLSRRTFLLGGGAALFAGAGTWACSRGPDYDEIAAALWTRRPAGELEALVHYATLAANSHNAQPWRFRPAADGVTILPDLARALPVADPDNHHLYVSLGCAAENLALAAGAAGRSAALQFTADGAGEVRIALGTDGRRDPLFEAITSRQCTRSDYDGRGVSAGDLARLEQAARLDGCELHLIDDPARIEQVLELILAATELQVADPAFADELKSWIRFNARAAVETGDGLIPPARATRRCRPSSGSGCSGCSSSPRRSRIATRGRCARAPDSRWSSPRATMPRTGSRPAAATSASRCRRHHSGFVTRTSTSRSRSPRRGANSRRCSGSATAGPTSCCATATRRPCRARCGDQ